MTQQLDKVFLTRDDRYLFNEGRNYQIYKKMGAHEGYLDGKKGMHFAVWAPHALAVSIVCDRNQWKPDKNYMLPLEESGIYEGFIPDMGYGETYKYAILTKNHQILYKADPFAFSSEVRPNNASVTADIDSFSFHDEKWLKERKEKDAFHGPLSIYEVHLGSWKRVNDQFMNYRQYAVELTNYVLDMGYTHVEIMGIAEHPFDGSWGYQVTGYYAPTSRYGTPSDFQYFVNYLHEHGIGVILDWVPAHFPKDAHGLSNFDGESLYEYPDPRMGEHPEWGTKIFNYAKSEVKNFLIANALYWFDMFHIDGLRVDAVASMLYLDYGRKEGQWVPNVYGGNENLDAVEFFKHLNSLIKKRNDGTMIIAEESTAWPKVTAAVEDGGLGFTYKWDMGWMHDFLDYMKLDPIYRKGSHNKMTFGMAYAFSEHFVLVLSHDEVVHLKCSMLNKMPGYPIDKFKNLKAGYLFMYGHVGKKLLFMGQDFGQSHEWDESVQLPWDEAKEENHADLQNYMRDLLHMYQKYPAFYKKDDSWDGFQWVNADDADRSIFSWIRKDGTGKNNLLFVVNMTPIERSDYMVGVPHRGRYSLIFNEHGNTTHQSIKKVYTAINGECDHLPYHVPYALPPYGCAVFKFNDEPKKSKK